MCEPTEKRAAPERGGAELGAALSSARMRAVEQAAIAAGSVTGLELMERAGRGVVAAVLARWPDLAAPGADGPRRACVLAGPGNNGGDGLVVARLLAARGWRVRVLVFGDPARLPRDAASNRDRWCAAGGTLAPGGAAGAVAEPVDLWVDAVFGIGLVRPLPAAVLDAFAAIAAARQAGAGGRLVAVDILSGLDADTGACLSSLPLAADLTVTFHRPKPGHLRGAGPAVSGALVVQDIGL
jgi:hydroxyethylthiazole kinase-like uncharacterized protein yjeF